jgi:hypothetical protein
MSAEEWERLKRRDRKIGLATELAEEWVEAATPRCRMNSRASTPS